MAIPLKYNTASQEIPLGYFLDSSDGDTEETGLTINNTDIKLWKSGATTLANKNSGGATHISNGIYYATLDATDTNTYGPLIIFVHVSGALAIRVECVVMEADAYDALYAAAGTGHIEADAVQVSGSSTAADNAEIVFDTDFATNYDTTNDKWQTEADVLQIEGSDATDQINAACDAAIETYGLDHLVSASVTGTDVANDSIIAKMVADDATADWDTYDNTTDSLEALRNHIGDGTNLTEAGGTGDQLTAVPWNSNWDAEVESECNDALVAQKLDHLVAVAESDDPVDNSIVAKLAASDGDWSGFSEATDSLEALRDNQPGTATEIADALLDRDMSAVSDTNDRSPLNALRFLRNKWEIVTGTLTVYEEDDSTSAWTASVSDDATADNVVELDPA